MPKGMEYERPDMGKDFNTSVGKSEKDFKDETMPATIPDGMTADQQRAHGMMTNGSDSYPNRGGRHDWPSAHDQSDSNPDKYRRPSWPRGMR